MTACAAAYVLFGMCIYRYNLDPSTEGAECEQASDEAETDVVRLTWVDAFYFVMVTISTVGYGDITPDTPALKTFTVFYILGGIMFVFTQLAFWSKGVLDWTRLLVLAILDRFDTTPKYITSDGKKNAHISGRSRGLSGRAIDTDYDGKADFIAPPDAVVYWAQELLPAFILFVTIQLGAAAFFCVLISDMGFGEALYHTMITATTVGYGDVAMPTQRARLFAALHVLVSVSWLAALVGDVEELRSRRAAELRRADLLTKKLDKDTILELDKDGKGVDKLEFVVGMLMSMGVELCGEPLDFKDVIPFIDKFENIATAGEGSDPNRITQKDLIAYLDEKNEGRQMQRDKMRKGKNKRAKSNETKVFKATAENLMAFKQKQKTIRCPQPRIVIAGKPCKQVWPAPDNTAPSEGAGGDGRSWPQMSGTNLVIEHTKVEQVDF